MGLQILKLFGRDLIGSVKDQAATTKKMRNLFIAIIIILSFKICNAKIQEVSNTTEDALLFRDTNIAKTNNEQLRFQLGYSKMIAPSGINFGVDYSYFPLKLIGIGGKYSFFQYRKKEKLDKIVTFREVITTHFFAPVLTLRIPDRQNKFYFFTNFSYGIVLYEDYAAIPGYNGTLSGITKGTTISFGFDFQIKKNKYLGFMISFLGAILNKYEISTPIIATTVMQNNNISRIDVSLCLLII